MKTFMTSILLSTMAFFICFYLWGMEEAVLAIGGIGLFFLVLSMITLGSMVSGDRARANFAAESPKERHDRTKIGSKFFLIGLLNLLFAVCLFYFSI